MITQGWITYSHHWSIRKIRTDILQQTECLKEVFALLAPNQYCLLLRPDSTMPVYQKGY